MSSEPPIRDIALCIELGLRPILALMTKADWNRRIRQELVPQEGRTDGP